MARWDKNNNKMQVLDTYETPQEAFDQLMRFIPKTQKIWEPFPGSGRSTEYMKKLGYDVDNGCDVDFFEQIKKQNGAPSKDHLLVTNPPFSKKQDIFDVLDEYDVDKICILIPAAMLFTKYFQIYIKDHRFQILVPLRRLNFHLPGQEDFVGKSSFDTCWLCRGLDPKLPRDIMISQPTLEDLQKMYYHSEKIKRKRNRDKRDREKSSKKVKTIK
tara:strand:+ start:6320 stop:6964 length:645 start_codon:yes stop_codon:yes gene_type:complete